MKPYSALRAALVQGFNLAEFRDLLTLVGINPDDIPGQGDGITEYVRQVTAYVQEHRKLDDLIAQCQLERPNVDWRSLLSQPSIVVEPPYPGMRPFDETAAHLFFGRNNEIAQVIHDLEGRHLVLIIGPSGVGKSSLVTAGVFPRLDGEGWLIKKPRLTAGQDPTDALVQMIGNGQSDVDRLLAGSPPARRLLVFVDQFEQLYALYDVATQRRYAERLVELQKLDNCVVLIALRADFFGHFMGSEELFSLAQHAQIAIRPLTGRPLRDAINLPASAVDVVVDPALVEAIAADAEGQPGTLPLVQETMRRLWPTQQDGEITLAAYEAMGEGDRSGLSVALEHAAEGALRNFTPAELKVARRILLDLVQLGEPGRTPNIRRSMPENELKAGRRDPEVFTDVLGKLSNNRLVIRSWSEALKVNLVDLSHDLIITEWPRLRGWLSEDLEKLRVQRILAQATSEWLASNKDDDDVLVGARLKELHDYADDPLDGLTPDQAAYLQRGDVLEARRERARYAGQGAGVAVGTGLGIGVAFGLAFYSAQNGSGVSAAMLAYGTITVAFAMLAIGLLIGVAIGLGLWFDRRRRRILATPILGAMGGGVALLVFSVTSGAFANIPVQMLAGMIFGACLAVGLGLRLKRMRRLAVLVVAGMVAMSVLYAASLYVTQNPARQSPLLVLLLAGALMGAIVAIAQSLTEVQSADRALFVT